MQRIGLVLFLGIIFPNLITGQVLFYQDVYHGGVMSLGFSTGSGSGKILNNASIPVNSRVEKAFLVAERNGNVKEITVALNNKNYTFNNSTVVTGGFNSFITNSVSWLNSSIHAIDITSFLNPMNSDFELIIPAHNVDSGGGYGSFYLFVFFSNPLYSKISTNLYFNNLNVSPNITYSLSSLNKVLFNKPVGLGVFLTDFCDTLEDGSYVKVNGQLVGLVGGKDLNAKGFCSGTYANYFHFDDSIIGLYDDTPDSLMAGSDVLADIKSYANFGDNLIDVDFEYQSAKGPFSNPVSA